VVSVSTDRQGRPEVDVDLEDNTAAVTVTIEKEIADLFDDNGELRLWEDSSGWNGYIREETEDGPVYYHVNTRHDEDDWIRRIRVGEQAVRDAVASHIEDPRAGGRGDFARRCNPR
jgi:hypothetical protein